LVELRRIAGRARGRVFAKLELLNPGGSIKDRAPRWQLLKRQNGKVSSKRAAR